MTEFKKKRKPQQNRERSPVAGLGGVSDTSPVTSDKSLDNTSDKPSPHPELTPLDIPRRHKPTRGISLAQLTGPLTPSPVQQDTSRSTGSHFHTESSAVDVDKHMMAYISSQFSLRRGVASSAAAVTHDPLADLYAVPEQFRTEKIVVPEGDLTSSAAMLSAIPEIDLGITARLTNIERTERARLTLPVAHTVSDESTTRFYRPPNRYKAPEQTLAGARLAAKRLPEEEGGEKRQRVRRLGPATDEVAVGRFLSRLRGK